MSPWWITAFGKSGFRRPYLHPPPFQKKKMLSRTAFNGVWHEHDPEAITRTSSISLINSLSTWNACRQGPSPGPFPSGSRKRQPETALSRESMARPLIFCKLEGAEVRAQFYELDEASLKSGREMPADDQPAARMAPSARMFVQRNFTFDLVNFFL